MARRRTRRTTTLTILSLLLLTALVTWGRPAAEHLYAWATGYIPIGPTAQTQESVAELDREVQEISELIQERQDKESPPQPGRPVWPAPGEFEITSDFGSRVHPILKVPKLHTGLDVGAPEGAQVVAYLGGRVILVDTLPAYGQIVVIDHGGRHATVYAHLSAVAVREGDQVVAGMLIGRVGSTGAVTGPHLHFEVRQNGEPVEPPPSAG